MSGARRSASERVIDGILRMAAPMFATGVLDRKALRARLRVLAAETGIRPQVDPRQIDMWAEEGDGHGF